MKKSRFSPIQIAKILKEFDAGKTAAEISREYGISTATFYKWRERYAGMSGKELKRIKELEQENRKLKQMYADLSLDHRILKDIVEKKLSVDAKSTVFNSLVEWVGFGVSDMLNK